METHLKTLFDEAVQRGKPLSMMVADIDYFKSVNDTHGHDAGDDVLEGVRHVRMSARTRAGSTWPADLGGEEFVVMMPDTDLAKAYMVGERLRQCIAAAPFQCCPAAHKSRSPQASASPLWKALKIRRTRSSSVRTRPSIAQSATAGTVLSLTPPDPVAGLVWAHYLRHIPSKTVDNRGLRIRGPAHMSCESLRLTLYFDRAFRLMAG